MVIITFNGTYLCGNGLVAAPHSDVFDQPEGFRIDSQDIGGEQNTLCATGPKLTVTGVGRYFGSFAVNRRHASPSAAAAFLLTHLAALDGIHTLAIKISAANSATATPLEILSLGHCQVRGKPGGFEGINTRHEYAWSGFLSAPS
ncbi:MAG: hypothetical protein QM784_27975 [Polyangiaceae bacterium]